MDASPPSAENDNLGPRRPAPTPQEINLKLTRTALFYAACGAVYCIKALEYPGATFDVKNRAQGVVEEVRVLFSLAQSALPHIGGEG